MTADGRIIEQRKRIVWVCQDHFGEVRPDEYFPARPSWGLCDICLVTRSINPRPYPEFIARVSKAEVNEYLKQHEVWT